MNVSGGGSGSGLPDGGSSGDFLRNTAPGEGGWSGGLNSSDVPFAHPKLNPYQVPASAGTDPIQFNSASYFIKGDLSLTDNVIQFGTSSLADAGVLQIVGVDVAGSGTKLTVRTQTANKLLIEGVAATTYDLQGVAGEYTVWMSDTEHWHLVSHYVPGASSGGGPDAMSSLRALNASGELASVPNNTTVPLDFTQVPTNDLGTGISTVNGGFAVTPGLYQVDLQFRVSTNVGTASLLMSFNGLGVLADGDGDGYMSLDGIGSGTSQRLISISYAINVPTSATIGVSARMENAVGATAMSVYPVGGTVTRIGSALS